MTDAFCEYNKNSNDMTVPDAGLKSGENGKMQYIPEQHLKIVVPPNDSNFVLIASALKTTERFI